MSAHDCVQIVLISHTKVCFWIELVIFLAVFCIKTNEVCVNETKNNEFGDVDLNLNNLIENNNTDKHSKDLKNKEDLKMDEKNKCKSKSKNNKKNKGQIIDKETFDKKSNSNENLLENSNNLNQDEKAGSQIIKKSNFLI